MQSRTSDVVLEMDHHHHRPKPATTRSQSMKDDDLITSRQDHHHHRPKPTKTLRRLSLSKPKARLLEYNYPLAPSSIPENINSPNNNDHKPTHSDDSSSSQDDDEWSHDDDFDETSTSLSSSKQKLHRRRKKFPLRYFIECVMFMAILACLVTSLTVHPFNRRKRVWKWCLMVMVTFCGRLVSGWMMAVAVFAIERNFMLREKVLYFVYGLRKGIQNCVWLGLVLLSWTFVFSPQLHKKYKLLDRVYRGLVAVLVAAVIWLVKIVLVKTLASSFHVATYFDRMKESVFHHYVLDTLSGPPAERAAVEQRSGLMESKSMPADGGRRRKRRVLGKSRSTNTTTSSSRKDTVEELRRLSLESRTSAWGIRRLVNHVMTSGLSTISKTVDDFAKAESEIGSEWQARGAAKRIFVNVAKPGAKYIEEEDLMRFLSRVEIHTIFPFFEGALETGRISKPSFRNWVVRAYLERKSLAHSLNDTRTAVHQLHKLASVVVVVIIAAVTVVLMGLANLQVIFFVTTQMVVVGVIFQNMCRNVFESIVFVFIMHPFDIGDRCVVDGVQIYYPNSVLLTKPISNFYRSPEMSDAVNFSVDISTSMDTIHALKKAIQIYIESKPGYWNPKHSVVVKEIAPMNLMNMALCVQHTINHQNYGERNYRMTELILELKGMFDNLGIRYRLLPQEIHLTRCDRFDDDAVAAKND
ncbi:unnamed protein product [Linum tenue]|uniref:Mechanosensitive ion channel protein n=1 Tax=Linum tenue TaxID=586396 RepID=A0AAV0LXM0_9ROSI|nr:unnamed protein product [Linum tenue]